MTYRNNDKAGHARSRVVRILLDKARVNDKHDPINCDRGFRDVRCEHDFPCTFGGWFEYLGLHVTWQVCVNRADNQLRYFVAQGPSSFCEILLRCFDLLLALKNNTVNRVDDCQDEDKRTVKKTRISPFGCVV
jgi:hypothetical protein